LLRVFSRKSYLNHLQEHPGWTPNVYVNGAIDRPIPLTEETIRGFIQTHADFGIQDPEMPLIACELVDKVPLHRVDGTYSAISYVAGSPKDTRVILVDGQPFNAFASLERAVSDALDRWQSQHPSQDLCIWADQICINQRDHVERALQVGLMRDIYRRSRDTIIWFPPWVEKTDSPPTSSKRQYARASDANRSSLAHCCQTLRLATAPDWDCAKTPAASPSISLLSWLPPAIPQKCRHGQTFSVRSTINQHIATLLEIPTQMFTWLDTVQHFIESPWWERSWVYQEFIASPNPIFLSGKIFIYWTDLQPLLQCVCSHLQSTIRSGLSDPIIRTRWQIAEYNGKEYQSYEERCKEYQDQKSKWKERHKKELQVISNRYGRLEEGGLFLNMLLGRRRRMKRELQKIYSYDQPPTQRPQEPLFIQYWPEPEELSRGYMVASSVESAQTTQKTLQQSGPNQILALLEQLPRKRATNNQNPVQKPIPITMIKEKWREKALSLVTDLDMSTMSSMVKGRSEVRHSQELTDLLQHSRNCKSSDPRDRVYAFIGLAHEEYDIAPDYHENHTIVHVLIDVARAIIKHDKSLAILTHAYRNREHSNVYLPTWVPDWLSKGTDRALDEYELWQRESLEEERPFNAGQALLALPDFREDEDPCNVDLKVQGYHIDTLVMDNRNRPVTGFATLRHIWTSSGQRAATIHNARPEDEIWVLHGATKPVILRLENEDENSYSFRGEALLCNDNSGKFSSVMFGSVGCADYLECIEAKIPGHELREIWLI
jgi:hypothetical protein